ncbi:MAG TPA: class I SAM-dependent methyltransferase [Verrucomicrobiae bacterium]|nr:class I SAM-dependent methyltransferase [Verrucomicrobiae bacterium]
MAETVDFTERYLRGETPWDTGTPCVELIQVLEAGKLTGKTVLEFGCGTGTNAVELARRGLVVTAVDIAAPAIQAAKDKARAAGVTVDFRVADVLRDTLGGPYDILFDRGVYHCLRTVDLKAFQEFLQKSTHPGSRWLSLAGNAREDTDPGPPVVTKEEIHTELGSLFEIVELREFRFDTYKPGFHPLGWSILMRRW